MASFSLYQNDILEIEGGFVNDPYDHGGATNKGITFNTFTMFPVDYTRDGIIDVRDLRLITDPWAQHIFKVNYWDKVKGDYINSQSFAELMADHAINAGSSRAVKMLQYLLGIPIDGVMGNQTLTALNNRLATSGKQLFDQYKSLRENYYLYLAADTLTVPSFAALLATMIRPDSTQQRFIDGWLNRVSKFNWSGAAASGTVGFILLGLAIFVYIKYKK